MRTPENDLTPGGHTGGERYSEATTNREQPFLTTGVPSSELTIISIAEARMFVDRFRTMAIELQGIAGRLQANHARPETLLRIDTRLAELVAIARRDDANLAEVIRLLGGRQCAAIPT